jgi:GTP-binding protein Era
MTHKSAFVSIVGRPNTGKSTLINALVGEKVAITSHHPNTTRGAIRGIITASDFQLVLVDTPGLHKPKTTLGSALNQVVSESIQDVDIVIQCIPAVEDIGDGDLYIAKELSALKGAVKVCAVTMIDMASPNELPKQLQAASVLANKAGFEWAEVIPVSAFTDTQIALLIKLLTKHAKEGPAFYPAEMKSDQDLELTISELIREAVITELFEEVPHSIAVVIDELSKREEKDLFDIHASIIVERDSQKGIIIGSKGAHLKDIGIRARKEIEKKLGSKIFLALHVKVIPNWQTDSKALAKLGLLSN